MSGKANSSGSFLCIFCQHFCQKKPLANLESLILLLAPLLCTALSYIIEALVFLIALHPPGTIPWGIYSLNPFLCHTSVLSTLIKHLSMIPRNCLQPALLCSIKPHIYISNFYVTNLLFHL